MLQLCHSALTRLGENLTACSPSSFHFFVRVWNYHRSNINLKVFLWQCVKLWPIFLWECVKLSPIFIWECVKLSPISYQSQLFPKAMQQPKYFSRNLRTCLIYYILWILQPRLFHMFNLESFFPFQICRHKYETTFCEFSNQDCDPQLDSMIMNRLGKLEMRKLSLPTIYQSPTDWPTHTLTHPTG